MPNPIETKLLSVFGTLPSKAKAFIGDNKVSLLTGVAGVSSLIGLRVVWDLLDALRTVPMLPTVLELVGLIYTVKFVANNLVRSSDREDLLYELEALKEEILGENCETIDLAPNLTFNPTVQEFKDVIESQDLG